MKEINKNPFAKFCEWYVETEVEEKKELSVDTTADDSIEDSPIPDDEPSETEESSGEKAKKEKKEKKENEELEEKPVHEPTSKESEDSHGGDESTDSIEDSPNPGDEPSESEESSGEDGGSGSTADSNAGEKNGGTCGTGTSNKGASGNKKEGSEPSDGEGEENSEKNEDSEPSNDEGEENSKEKNSGGSSGGVMNSGSLFGSDCQSAGIISRRFNAAFIRVIDEMNGRQLTEESGNILSVQELLRRKLTKQSLSRCYVSEKKPEVVIVLDSSGSMSEVIPVLEQLSEYAKRMFGNLVLEAPNMQFSEEDEETFNSAEVLFFVGDFDGIDVILGAAKAGKEVYWLCNESRYDSPADHGWCSYGETEATRILSSNNMHYVRCCCLGEPEFNEKLRLNALNKLI